MRPGSKVALAAGFFHKIFGDNYFKPNKLKQLRGTIIFMSGEFSYVEWDNEDFPAWNYTLDLTDNFRSFE